MLLVTAISQQYSFLVFMVYCIVLLDKLGGLLLHVKIILRAINFKHYYKF